MKQIRESINLAGEWNFVLDMTSSGITPYTAGFWEEKFPDSLILPGDLARNRKGVETRLFTKHSISTRYSYSGVAWYQREIEIPETWRGKHIELHLERAQCTMVWVDDNLIGSHDNQETEQNFDISKAAYPGKHKITIRNDNSPQRPKHSNRRYSCSNGIFGEIALWAMDPVYFKEVYVKPYLQEKTARIHMWIGNQTRVNAWGEITLKAATLDGNHRVPAKRQRFLVECSRDCKLIEYEMFLGEDIKLWDEFDPNVYQLELEMKVTAGDQALQDKVNVRFGMREFKCIGTQFAVNGKKVFLRGDALLHELFMERTNRNPYCVEDWKEILQRYKEYGINHLRFHTHVPPKALFAAADEVGIYVQAELTLGGGNGMTIAGPDSLDYDPMLEPVMKQRGKEKILWLYNHPSFVMLTMGNEINGDMTVPKNLVEYLRSFDDTRLYAHGTNHHLRASYLLPEDDFWVTEKVSERDNVRGSVSLIYPPVGSVQDEYPRNSLRDYTDVIKDIPIPVVAHEMGQYETTMNFDEIDRLDLSYEYPGNMYYAKDIMERNGLCHKEKDFYRDSGKLSALCYREDIETMMRTPGFGGFQIMTLTDIQMAGSAVTGILDMFFEDKHMVAARDWRCYCAPRVVLLRIGGYTFHSGDCVPAKIQLANYGPTAMNCSVPYWKLIDGKTTVAEAKLPPVDIPQGSLTDLGEIELNFHSDQAKKLVLEVGIEGEDLYNRYHLWVWPSKSPQVKSTGILPTRCIETALKELRNGKKVLYTNGLLSQDKTILGYFAANFWSLTMFAGEGLNQYQTWPNEAPRGCMTPSGSMGLSYDPNHPVLKYFPSDGYSDYQWFPIIMASNPVILDQFPEKIEPIIWTIDSPQRGHRIGTLFELKVGEGKLMICTADLDAIQDSQASWLKKGILEYMESADFNPTSNIPEEFLRDFFS